MLVKRLGKNFIDIEEMQGVIPRDSVATSVHIPTHPKINIISPSIENEHLFTT